MKVVIDTETRSLTEHMDGAEHEHPLYSKKAFELLSDLWVKVGWDQKYSYTFSWMGRPVIQLPEDLIRTQEVIYDLRPDVIIETGVAHGGSLIFYAGLCTAMKHGRVIGVDIEIRQQNREAIESHEMSSLITLIEGDSSAPKTVERVQSLIRPGETVLVILDSCHTRQHVLAELNAYQGLVTKDSWIVATDGIMRDVYDVPLGSEEWKEDHPAAAAQDFLKLHPEFKLDVPQWPFNESELTENITHWPGAWLRRAA